MGASGVIGIIMSNEEWQEHVRQLQIHVDEFNHFDSGYTHKQKEMFTNQRINAIREIKRDLEWPPFREIAERVSYSHFGFDECYDTMDGLMEQTIREIMNIKL